MKGKLMFLLSVLWLISINAYGQARIGLDGSRKLKSAQASERPESSTLYSLTDSIYYRQLLTDAYRALAKDSFGVAKKNFESALKSLPRMDTNVEVLYQLGQLEERESRHQSAIQYYTRAVKKNPGFVKGYLRRGGMYLLLNETENAVKDFDEVLRLDAKNEDALFFRGCAYAKVEQWHQASSDFNHILDITPLNERAAYSLAIVEVQQKKLTDALVRMNGLILRHSSNSQYYAMRADINEKLGAFADAENDWQKAFELSSKDLSLVEGYSLFLTRQRRKDDALNVLERARNAGIPAVQLESLQQQIKKMKSR